VNRLSSAYSTNQNETRGFSASDRSTSELMFRRARRHSRRVRVLRVTIPIVLVIGVVVTTLVVYYNPLRILVALPASIGRLTVSGTKVTMTEPKLAGFTRDERRYELTAVAAAQDVTKMDVVNFEEPRASLEMADGSTVNMRAAIGMFDRKANLLTLRRDIVLTSTSGYEAHLSQAVVDVKNGNIISEEPVEVMSQQGTLRGNRLEIMKSGEIVRFDGGVTMMLMPENAPSEKAPSQESKPDEPKVPK
jgi:lipopolysaccharide export system protein LptC